MAESLLHGLRVLDLSLWQPGHYASQLLADLGAEVIKVEPPGGDRMRPMVDRFVNFNGRKSSVVLNLKLESDREAFLGLVRGAEVVLEGFRPGVMDRLGIGFAALRAVNPSIVLCSISGFGQDGPLSGVPGHDANYQAYAGAMTVRAGHEPVPSALLIADQSSGLAAAFAILAAVVGARRTGEAEHVDVSMTDLLATWVAPLGPVDERREESAATPGHQSPGMGTYATADGQWVVLGVFSEDHFWRELCLALGLDAFADLSTAERSDRHDEVRPLLAAAISDFTQQDLLTLLNARAVPVAPVRTKAQMLQEEHFRVRGILVEGPDGFRSLGHPIRFREHPALPPGAPPDLPAHASSDVAS